MVGKIVGVQELTDIFHTIDLQEAHSNTAGTSQMSSTIPDSNEASGSRVKAENKQNLEN